MWSKVDGVVCLNRKRHNGKIKTPAKCSALCLNSDGCKFGFAFSSRFTNCDFCRDNKTKSFKYGDVYRRNGSIPISFESENVDRA